MDHTGIKEKLHCLIDQIVDKQALEKLYAEALELKYSWIEEDALTEEEWAEVDEGLAQIRNDEECTHVAAMEKFRQWLCKK
jgi:hypothetical protein